MKTLLTLLLFLLSYTYSYAQSNQAIVLTYDKSGNRETRKVTTLTQTRSLSDQQEREDTFDNEYALDLSSYTSGIYILSIQMENSKEEFKIIKE